MSHLSGIEKCWGNWDYLQLGEFLSLFFFSPPDNQSVISIDLVDSYFVLIVLPVRRGM